MKRSEMINEITDIIYLATCADLILDTYEAELILTKLEEAGMLPPYKTKSRQGTNSTCQHAWDDEKDKG